ncbi:cell division transport system ATP-binding protein [Anaerobranca californiensis DSM 14826]|uniref:Cell division ATP-binding protein FtsE n=1 Tax=Anaerobranca californiensis DSM 14826 TaxID=1120989 RepID=A0A1M6PDB7_9FIRM|nr:cell division ATP-binding protein FtsE [Anaerobranca californiensis]SHK05943.1 cell division transport system ATP-binding protein [Anaerobranca californiensis DSM 14826]
MIIFQNVSICYPNGTYALTDVNLKIDKGEFVYIVGPSGAGKSSLLKAIYKEVDIKKGQLFMFNRNVTMMKDREIPYLRRQMGVVFQDFRLLSEKNVYENVAFALRVINTPSREIKKRVLQVLEFVGLKDKIKSYPHQLSGGEQQRVSIARALVNQPSLLVCDEPTGNLDPETSEEIMTLLNKVNLRGTTIVMATHARDIVDRYRHRVIGVKNGQIVRDDIKGGYNNDF